MPTKPILLYELDAIVDDDLGRITGELAESVERSEDEVSQAIAKTAERYQRGELTQNEHWGKVALALALEDIEAISAFAIQGAEVNRTLLGRIRAQSPTSVLGLVSDATPDFVGHFRKTYQLDELIHVHVIGSELDEERDYPGLLKLAAERLQASPGRVNFVDSKPVHIERAKSLGMRWVDSSDSANYKTAFADLA